MKTISAKFFAEHLLRGGATLDVRAEVEFNEGHLPCSTNIPILNDQERKEIGTLYKQQGQDTAIRRGYELVSGAIKEQRLTHWIQFYQSNPEAILTCFRGGLRSKITQQWLSEAGVNVLRAEGGYKALRSVITQSLTQAPSGNLVVLSGTTGTGKTRLLGSVADSCFVLDLEKLAHHRGSAFGSHPDPQPSQVTFENRLFVPLERFKQKIVGAAKAPSLLIEDESRCVGKCVLPDALFFKMREASVVLIEETLEFRVAETMREYILDIPAAELADRLTYYHHALARISKKLGGLRFQEIHQDLLLAQAKWTDHQDLSPNTIWIEKLLVWYYDPTYQNSLSRRSPLILFKGRYDEVKNFILQNHAQSE